MQLKEALRERARLFHPDRHLAHTRVYEDILAGGGFGIEEARKSIELVHRIRHSQPDISNGKRHRLLR